VVFSRGSTSLPHSRRLLCRDFNQNTSATYASDRSIFPIAGRPLAEGFPGKIFRSMIRRGVTIEGDEGDPIDERR
jgi:hypothetical protein